MNNNVTLNRMMLDLRAMQLESQIKPAADQVLPAEKELSVERKETPHFATLFKQAINSVNELQQESSDLKTRYQFSDPEVSLSDVMVAGQKASVAFDAMVEVRNKLVQAYEEIMKMPV
ncbi:flagellar hook-basal body complex protein FliE [Zooshikella harenae]|uniref:Flagellar hook-basal body complex protein FliE n=1 Tax=Zooshikella harenae TaxID=2827238 RepID=A0ABS5ZB00_9GAMM|nr:flagellar hook-basal body complex protein FliE [Zooshikella harenae]MBU2710476.1 flagellar hook-basal body complex protein FliE [Zooshikella harenae]